MNAKNLLTTMTMLMLCAIPTVAADSPTVTFGIEEDVYYIETRVVILAEDGGLASCEDANGYCPATVDVYRETNGEAGWQKESDHHWTQISVYVPPLRD